MYRKFPQFILLALLFLLLAAAPAQPARAADLVAVRIATDGGIQVNRDALKSDRVIDYGSFLWVVMDREALSGLEKSGEAYQTIEDPYTLTLGGQSFDPLTKEPAFGLAWGSRASSSGAGMHLVQFHGPVKDEWLKELEGTGLEIIQYIHPFTYVVWGDTAALDRSKVQDAVRWAGDYLPAYAVNPQNRALAADPLLVRAVILPQAGLEVTVQAIEALGGQPIGSASGVDPAFDLATFILPGNQLLAAASLPGVYTISPVALDGGDRGELSNQVNVDNIDGTNAAYPGYQDWLDQVGLSGAGVVIANVDSGVDQTHPDLVNRFLSCTGTTCSNTASDHGTHTAGLMAGDGSSGITLNGFLRGLGMAPGANLIEQVYYPTYLDAGGMLTLITQSYQNGAVVSGNSWGPSGSPLGYDEDTRLVDVGVRDADPVAPGNQQLSYVLSIMNGYGGTSTQGTPDEAKNVFTIGSTYLQNSSGAQYLNINDISDNSAHGPALDGRTIPHMVAPGKYVDSTYYPGSGYALMAGTSMSSPQVTGAVALFIERYRNIYGAEPSPALVKAAFLPVAHDLAGNLNADEDPLGHPFDSKQGWGRLDASAVLAPKATTLFFDQETLLDNTGETWTYTIEAAATVPYLHAMLVWTDAPGTPNELTTPAWVNDLDFSITIDGNTYLGNNFGVDGLSTTGGSADYRNNTEGVFLENLPSGEITFTVTAANLPGDGVPNAGDATDQDFALVIYISPSAFPIRGIFPIFYH